MDVDRFAELLEKERLLLPIYNESIVARPPIKGVHEKHLVAYLLSMAYRLAFKIDKKIACLLYQIKPIMRPLTQVKKEKNGLYSYHHIMEAAVLYLQDFTALLRTSSHDLQFSYPSVDFCNDKHKRSKQEDRYFYTLDLENYHEASSDSELLHPSMAFGLFDGHGGHEVAEHCSILAPYLMSKLFRRRQQKENQSSGSITGILTEVFRQLNASVQEGASKNNAKDRLWRSASTATICLLHQGVVYTAWIGDSQAWLAFQAPGTVDVGKLREEDLARHRFYPGDVELLNAGLSVDQVVAYSEVAMDYERCIYLTDMVHKASNQEEFVSVSRRNGFITVQRQQDSSNNNNWLLDQADGLMEVPATPTVDRSSKQLSSLLQEANTTAGRLDSWRAKFGFVPTASELTTGRVAGICEVTRSFGDDIYIAGMHALPSITVCPLLNGEAQNCRPKVMLLASDGLWDTSGCSGPTTTRIASQYVRSKGAVLDLSKLLAERAKYKGSTDNITIVAVDLGPLVDLVAAAHQPTREDLLTLRRGEFLWPLGNRTASVTNVSWTPKLNRLRGPNPQHEQLQHNNRPFSDSFMHQTIDLGISSPVRMLEVD